MLWSLTAPPGAWAQEVVAVLSSELGPYRQAFDGFQNAFGRPVSTIVLQGQEPTLPSETRIVVTFGGRAAQGPYPDHVLVISCMAPGGAWSRRHGTAIEVPMLPRAAAVLVRLRDIQPTVKRLAVLWASAPFEPYVRDMREAAAAMGITLLAEQLDGPDGLPDRLRALLEMTDALWLLPDPVLVNARSFSVLKEYSWSNRVPFYAPTAGLVEQGATAAIANSFREIGRTAALAARRTLDGESVGATAYPERIEVTVNVTAAGKTGLAIPPPALQRVDRVLP